MSKNTVSILYYKNKIPLCNKRMLNEYIKNNNKKDYLNFNNILIALILIFVIVCIGILYRNKKAMIN